MQGKMPKKFAHFMHFLWPASLFLSLSFLPRQCLEFQMRKYPSKFLKAARLLDVWQCAMCKVHNDASCSFSLTLTLYLSLSLSFFLLFEEAFDMLNLTLTFAQEIIEMRLEQKACRK